MSCFFVQNGILKECFSFVNVPLPVFYPVAETFRLLKEGKFPCKQKTSEISTHRGDKKTDSETQQLFKAGIFFKFFFFLQCG